MSLFQLGPDTATQRYWKKNRNTISNYIQFSKVPVVFAGSSLTATLDFSDETECVYNIGLIGESALTGLDVIQTIGHKPRVVYVEINFPERESNTYLISNANGFLAKNFPQFIYTPPVNYAVSLLSSLYHFIKDAPLQTVDLGIDSDKELARTNEIALQKETLAELMPSNVLATKLSEFRAKINDLEKKGIKVIFYEMPVYPELSSSNQVMQVRRAFKESFPDNNFISSAELANGISIKTVDGLHLNQDDVVGVLSNLKDFYRDECRKEGYL